MIRGRLPEVAKCLTTQIAFAASPVSPKRDASTPSSRFDGDVSELSYVNSASTTSGSSPAAKHHHRPKRGSPRVGFRVTSSDSHHHVASYTF